jgi:hypothetical protein
VPQTLPGRRPPSVRGGSSDPGPDHLTRDLADEFHAARDAVQVEDPILGGPDHDDAA